jgi:hypothetical protein
VIFNGEAQFVISGNLLIEDCVWDINNVTNSDINPQFFPDGGLFTCNNMIINSFIKTNLKLLKCNTTSKINLQHLIFKDIIINKEYQHFNLIGETNIGNSVFFIDYNFNFFFLRILKMFLE